MNNKATVFFKAGKDNYAFPFPYLSKQFVKVRYDKKYGTDELEYNRDYTIEGQTVMLRQKGDEQSTICIYRQTPTGSLVDFNDGSILLASEMDKMAMQMLHIEEENSDYLLINGMLTDKTTNAWQGQGRRIAHLEDPIDAQDAVTLHHLETVGGMASLKELQDIKEGTLAIKKDTNEIKNMAYQLRQDALQAYQLTENSKEAVKTMETHVLNLRNEAGQQSAHIEQMQEDIQKAEQRVHQKEADAGRSKEQAEQAAETANTKALEAKQSAISAQKAAADALQHSSNSFAGAQESAARVQEVKSYMQEIGSKGEEVHKDAETANTKALEAASYARYAASSLELAGKCAQDAQQYAAEAQSHAHFNGVIETHNIKDEAVTRAKLDSAIRAKIDNASILKDKSITSEKLSEDLQKKVGLAFSYMRLLTEGMPYSHGSILDRNKTGSGDLYGKDIFFNEFFTNYTYIYVIYLAPLQPQCTPVVHVKTYEGKPLWYALENAEYFNLTGDSNAPYVVKGRRNNAEDITTHLQFCPMGGNTISGIVDIIGYKFYG